MSEEILHPHMGATAILQSEVALAIAIIVKSLKEQPNFDVPGYEALIQKALDPNRLSPVGGLTSTILNATLEKPNY